jgi:hypothetical protein
VAVHSQYILYIISTLIQFAFGTCNDVYAVRYAYLLDNMQLCASLLSIGNFEHSLSDLGTPITKAQVS